MAAVCLAVIASSIASAAPQPLAATLGKDQLAVAVAGKIFTVYRFGPKLKKPYFWPVIGPRSGKSVTVESVPNQYPHHNSIWLGCDRVNNHNFWQPHGHIENGQIKSVGPKLVQAQGEAVVFTDECIWQKPGAEPVMRDRRRVAIRAPSADLRFIDFDVTLHMLTDVTVRKTNHSLFSVRMMPELSVKSGGTLVNAEGSEGEKGTFGKASPWCDYYGTRGGVTEGVALFQNPANRWYPCKWFTRDYGFMSPTPMYWPPNGKDIRFRKGEEVRLRYRVVVHAGDVNEAGIAALFQQYAPNAAAAQLDRVLDAIKNYRVGESRKPLLRATTLIRSAQASPALRAKAEARLAALLASDATFACKQFVCHRLSEVGTDLSVPALAELLADEKLSNAARFALQRIPAPKAGAALRAALARVTGKLRIGVVNSLAERSDRQAVPALATLAAGQAPALAAAAIEALGRIGGAAAARRLAELKAAGRLAALRADARLLCADRMCEAGQAAAGIAVYRELLAGGHDPRTRAAALEGLVRAQKQAALPTLLALLKDDHALVRRAAAKLSSRVPGEAATKALAAALPSLRPDAQVALITALRARRDRLAAPAALKAATSTDEGVRVAAIRALGVLGDASHVALLTKTAAAGGRAGKAAAESLLLLDADGVDATMAQAVKRAGPAARVVLIRALVGREYRAVMPVLFDALDPYDAKVHKAACKALGSRAGMDELPALAVRLPAAQPAAARRDLAQALSAACARLNDPNASAEPVVAGLATADDDAKARLLAILHRIGGPKALAAIRGQLASQSPAVKKAAIQALADWADPSPMADLLSLAKQETNLVNHVLALRGYIKQATLPSSRPPAATVKLLREAMGLAQRAEEKKAILAALPSYPCDDAIALAKSCLGDTDVAEEAKLAIKLLERKGGLKFDFQPQGAPVMENFMEVSQSTTYTDARGYGWLKAPSAARDRQKGSALERDFLFDTRPRTFRVRVPNGAHVVTVFLGDMTTSHDRMEVLAEGEFKLRKIRNRAGEVRELFFDVDVEDGFLDVEFRDAGGNPHWTCAGLMIGK